MIGVAKESGHKIAYVIPDNESGMGGAEIESLVIISLLGID
jgi:hypothetical protein